MTAAHTPLGPRPARLKTLKPETLQGRPYRVSRLAIPGGEGIGEGLGADSVDGADEVAVGYRSVPRLDAPHGLTQRPDGGGWVEHNLGAV